MTIAVDFDGTLFENKWPEIGEPKYKIINYIKRKKKQGHEIILFTCRSDQHLIEAIEACRKVEIEFDAVNENLLRIKEKYGNDPRKIWFDILIDDKAINVNDLEMLEG